MANQLSDGDKAVRNLELATWNRIIMDNNFTSNIIMPKAELLTVQYSQILEPLFRKTSRAAILKNFNGLSTWNDDEEI